MRLLCGVSRFVEYLTHLTHLAGYASPHFYDFVEQEQLIMTIFVSERILRDALTWRLKQFPPSLPYCSRVLNVFMRI